MNSLKKRIKPHTYLIRGAVIAATLAVLCVVGFILIYLLAKGLPHVTLNFLTTAPSYLDGNIGILPILINTLYIIVFALLVSLPLGVGAAIYLSEFAKQGRVVSVIRYTIEILAGIPSIIYGLFGMVFFVTFLGLQYSILSGGLTLSIMILPIMIRTTEEALLAVDKTYREGAVSLGVSRLHILKTILVPCAMPGILTATILSIGRIVGESAALLYTAGIAYDMPTNLVSHFADGGATLSVQMYLYATEGMVDISVPFSMAAILIILVFIINFCAARLAALFKR